MSRRTVLLIVEIASPVLVLVLWGVWSANSSNPYFPPLTHILSVFRQTWLFDRFGSDVVPSLSRMLAGFLLSVVTGVPLGVLIGLSRPLGAAVAPVIEFVRAIPPPALIPFAIVVMGIGNAMKVFIIVIVGVFPVLLSAIDGVRGVDPRLRETARAYRIGP